MAELQLARLGGDGAVQPWHYLGVFLEDDSALAPQVTSNVTGQILDKWWDGSAEAGPKRRPRSSFGVDQPQLETLVVSEGQLKTSGSIYRCMIFRYFQ